MGLAERARVVVGKCATPTFFWQRFARGSRVGTGDAYLGTNRGKPEGSLAEGRAETHNGGDTMLLVILIVLLVLSLAGGGWGYSRWGYAGMSPAGIILLVLAILWLTGHL